MYGGVFGGAPQRYVRFEPSFKFWHVSITAPTLSQVITTTYHAFKFMSTVKFGPWLLRFLNLFAQGVKSYDMKSQNTAQCICCLPFPVSWVIYNEQKFIKNWQKYFITWNDNISKYIIKSEYTVLHHNIAVILSMESHSSCFKITISRLFTKIYNIKMYHFLFF